jgi:hypothetical protein
LTARGLFRATGKAAKPVMADLIDGQAIYVDALPREENDFYPTPPEPTRALIRAERLRLNSFKSVWEPACGDGAMAREIRAYGIETVCSDLIDRGAGAEIRSFYDFDTAPSQAIVTNPPFQECNSGAWIKHAIGCLGVDYMALLLPLSWLGAETRAALWAQYTPARVYLMRWRIDFTGAGASPMLNAWFVWDASAPKGETTLHMLSKRDAEQEGFL